MNIPLRIVSQDPPVSPKMDSSVWLASAFRPFFAASALMAVFWILAWALELRGAQLIPHAPFGTWWHGHEMIFGFAGSVVAGFLLTAAGNWTGLPMLRGPGLGALWGMWLAARLGLLVAPPWMLLPVAILDLAFFPGLALALAIPIGRARQWRNLIFVPVLLALTLCNAGYWAQLLGFSATSAIWAREAAVGLILILVAIIGGRVIPFFASRALPDCPVRSRGLWETLSLPSLVLAVLAPLAGESLQVLAYSFVALVHLGRWSRFFYVRVLRVPLLWVLYIGYLFLPLGYALKAAGVWGFFPLHLALHAHTVGCIGVMILGMMARVSLGHSGREIRPRRVTTVSFGLIIVAALLRSVAPAIWPSRYADWLALSSLAWVLSFGIFAWVYLPILGRPRLDGKPG